MVWFVLCLSCCCLVLVPSLICLSWSVWCLVCSLSGLASCVSLPVSGRAWIINCVIMTHLIIQLGVGFGGGAALPGLPGRGRIPARGIIRWQKMCHLINRHPFPRTCPVSTSSGPADGPLRRMRAGRRVRHERPSTGRLRRSWRAARPAGRGYHLRHNDASDNPNAPSRPSRLLLTGLSGASL